MSLYSLFRSLYFLGGAWGHTVAYGCMCVWGHCMHASMQGWVDVYLFVCMYKYTYIYISICQNAVSQNSSGTDCTWTTSSRMHEKEIRTCLFGCPESADEVGHYLRCPFLWVCIDLRPPPESPEAVIDRLCLKCPVLTTAYEGLLLPPLYTMPPRTSTCT